MRKGTDDMSLLRVQDLNVQFYDRQERREAVSHLSFEVEAGEILGIAGESGSGKSTAMEAVLGLLPGTARVSCGQMVFQDRDITPPDFGVAQRNEIKAYEQKMESVRGSQIAMVFQDPLACLNPSIKIGKQVAQAYRIHTKCGRRAAEERTEELLDMVGIRDPRKRMGQYPFELSGGMRQRAVIAAALACGPKLLIADEPTTALDVTVQRQILRLLEKISVETKTAILIVSHDLGVIAALSQRVLVMQHGILAEEGRAEDIFYDPGHPYTKELLARTLKLGKMAESRSFGEVLLEASHVAKYFPGTEVPKYVRRRQVTEAVQDVSFQIARGECFGLVGESGCGKTTLAGMVTGILKPTKGQVLYKGEPMKNPVQMVFQDPYASLNPRMKVEELLEEPLLLNTPLTKTQRRERAEEMLKLVGLQAKDLDKYPGSFSGGERQRIGIARALIPGAGLIVCDEPVSALDVPTQEQILKLLEEIQKKTGVSYLFISHDLNIVKRISHRVGVMYGGRILETGDTKEIYKDPWHPYTKALLSAILIPNPVKARRQSYHPYPEERKRKAAAGTGCPFADRCGYAMERCFMEKPETYPFERRSCACFLYSKEHAGKRDSGLRMTSQV